VHSRNSSQNESKHPVSNPLSSPFSEKVFRENPSATRKCCLYNSGVGPCRNDYLEDEQHDNPLAAFRGYYNLHKY